MRKAWTSAVAVLAICIATTSSRAVTVTGYAITGARVVTVSGETLDRATVVIRDGAIEQVGSLAGPPDDVQAIDGGGLTVYPGLIDLHSHAGVTLTGPAAPQNPESREIVERWRRQQLRQSHVRAADVLDHDAPELAKMLAAGITSALVVPKAEGFAGQSALVHLAPPELDPQVGRLAIDPRGGMIVKTPVALHVSFPGRNRAAAYPASLMGGIAFVRQTFLDARHYRAAAGQAALAGDRPPHDRALEAMDPAVGRRLPVAFEASSPREIRRALALARELDLDPIVVGAHGAGRVVQDLKQAGARVILSAAFPVRPKSLAPDADEPLDDVQARADARTAAAALAAAGVPFGFGGADLKDPKELIASVRTAIEQGLSEQAAIRALTLDAARIAGAGSTLGAVEAGRPADLIVTDGPLFAEKTTVKHVFVGGRRVLLP